MKRILIILSLLLCFSCKPQHQIIVEHVTQTNYVDSLVIRDSVVTIPVERYVDLVREYDTLKLSTSLASAEAWLDTTNSCLRGSIWNKNSYTYEKEVIDHYITKDSIVYKEKPVPYPVEVVKTKNAAWWVWVWALLSSLSLCGVLYWHFRDKIRKLFVHL